MALDDATDYGWSFFLKQKNETAGTLVRLLKEIKAKTEHTVKYIRCDNSGENKSFEDKCRDEFPGVIFEYTGAGTPQRNGRVERKFATLYGRIRASYYHAGILKDDPFRIGTWTECANYHQDTENILVSENKPISSHRQLYERDPIYARHLRTFGEMAVVSYYHDKKMRGKMDKRGRTAMFLGYTKNHADDVYRLVDLETNGLLQSRDILWLNQTYGKYKGTNPRPKVVVIDDDDEEVVPLAEETRITNELIRSAEPFEPEWNGDTDAPQPPDSEAGREEPDQATQQERPARMTRQEREMRRLQTFFNPNPGAGDTEESTADDRLGRENDAADFQNETVETVTSQNETAVTQNKTPQDDNDETKEDENETIENEATTEMDAAHLLIDHCFAQEEEVEYDEPTKFKDAWDHEDPKQREKWRDAINKELNDMKNRNVWTLIPRTQIPRDRRCVKSKWVFKVKRNGVFRARLVACGYSQIPGVDFTESYAPVVNDITFRIMILLSMIYKLNNVIIDVETAFLHGDLAEDIYMDAPEGLINNGAHVRQENSLCCKLNQTIYGLIQSAREFFKRLSAKLKAIGFKQGYADPCLLTRNDDDGMIYIALYVDDCYCCGTKKAIESTIAGLKKQGFTLKIETDMTDYLSCNIVFNDDKTKATLRQPHLIKSMKAKFGELVKTMTHYKTPGTPGQGIVRPDDKLPSVTPDEHRVYRSGVGTLLYLVKHSRPDIANVVRELSKVLDCPTQAAFNEMKRAIKFVLDTEDYGLRIEPKFGGTNQEWDIVAFSDSDWAGDKQTRISVSGFAIFLLGVPISWKSKAQRSVALSSSEAEIVALSEAAKEIKFIAQLLITMGVKVKLPIICRVDNIGAIFMAENVTTTSRAKHLDLRTRYVTEFIEDGFIKIIFVKTAENLSDWFTKNVSSQIYDDHKEKYIKRVES